MPKRILVLNERDMVNPLAGGAEVHLFEIFGRLARKGHHIKLLAASFPGCADREDVEGIEVRRLANRYLYYGLVPFVARAEARSGRYDLVVDVLHKLPFLSPWFVPVPCLAVVHHLFGTTAFRQVSFPVALATVLSEKLIPLAYRHTPMVAVSPSTRDDLVARGVPRRNISVVPNGIDHESYRADGAKKDVRPLVTWLGRVEKYKRVDVFVRALARVRERVANVRAVVIGEGTALEQAKKLTVELGLSDTIEFLGFVDQKTKIDFLRRSHVLVNSSEKEGWGLTVIEGNACGAPTIGSDVQGLRDSIRDGVTGLLVEHGDVEDLAKAIIAVLGDDELRERLSRSALEWASRFRWEASASQIEGLIDAVAAGTEPATISITAPMFAGK